MGIERRSAIDQYRFDRPMEFVTYSDWDQLPDSANELIKKGEQESLFFSREWFQNLAVNALGENDCITLACVVAGDKVMAILPLIKLDGQTYASLSTYYTSLYSLLISDFEQQAIFICLAEGLKQQQIQSLRLVPVDDSDPVLHELQRAMEASGFETHRHFRFYNWIHRCQGQSFDQYMATRPGRVRSTVARKRRKLEREHGLSIRLFIDSDDLDQALADYKTIYRASWKADERVSGFVGSLVRHLSRRGWLRLAILYADERPIAGQIWFVVHGKASIFRLAYDQSWQRYSPGSILTAYLMQYVIDTDGVEEIDFLTGNERYKQDWMSERRERWSLAFINKRKAPGRIHSISNSLKNLFTKQPH